tara:strand:+ start:1983 stop:3374 length:1392 start_codon:yes stop_codon:yes gene_type:complete
VQAADRFPERIVALDGPAAGTMRLDVDEANRPDNTVETPARLRSALRPEGIVTADHAPGLYSGAAALPAAERALAEAQGLRPSDTNERDYAREVAHPPRLPLIEGPRDDRFALERVLDVALTPPPHRCGPYARGGTRRCAGSTQPAPGGSGLAVFKATLEAVDRPWLGTGFAMLAVVAKLPLNQALIWGIEPVPMLGLTGAGVASLLAETLALAAAWLYWQRARSMRRWRLRSVVSGRAMASLAREGAPLGLMYVAETGAVAVATLVIGTFGAVALAGNQVAMSVGGLLYMVPLGVAGAVAIRVAQERGARNDEALRPIAWAALSLATVWLALAAAVLGLHGQAIARSITQQPEVVAVAATLFFVFACSQVMDGVQSTMTGALRGLSDTGFPAWLSLLAYWALGLPLGWALAHPAGWGPAGVWTGFVVALGLVAPMLVWRFVKQTHRHDVAARAHKTPGEQAC